ncbi:MAG: N-acetylglucosamine-6-phosphate deacetylase [Eubacteriales bacterium]|nr:N-acetylglucosamine-6-phosphate deacetylase [Eubacteriales bacterium]
MKFINGTVFTEKDGFVEADLTVRDGRIISIDYRNGDAPRAASGKNAGVTESPSAETVGAPDASVSPKAAEAEEIVDLSGSYLLPGLVDLHFHGCAGYDFCDGTPEAFAAIEEYELSHGITSLCPATMTYPEEKLTQILTAAAEYRKHSRYGAALLHGANLEGPFLSEAKKGAQNAAYLMKPDAEMVLRLQQKSGNFARMIDIAPEVEGAMDCIHMLSRSMVVSIAHTTADYDTACAAFDAGASHVTHFYNAMPPFTHRAPGVIGAAADKNAEAELICDGIHIHPSVIRATFKLLGYDRMILISDSMMATGMEDGQYSLGGQAVTVRGNEARLADGTIAGSATNLYDCMVNAIRFGVPAWQAIRAASYNPARSIGILDSYGSIREGKAADLLVTDRDYRLLRVYKGGEAV